MTLRLPLVALLSFCILATGCQTGSRRTVARYEPGDIPDTRQAPLWGEYMLYTLPKNARNPAADAEPLAKVRLAGEEWVGFKRDASGYVVAAAAEQTFPLERQQSYAWVVQPDVEQPGGNAGVSLGVLAVFTIVIVAGAAALYGL